MTPVSYKRVSHFVTAYLEDVKLSLAADLVCVDSVYDVRRRYYNGYDTQEWNESFVAYSAFMSTKAWSNTLVKFCPAL